MEATFSLAKVWGWASGRPQTGLALAGCGPEAQSSMRSRTWTT